MIASFHPFRDIGNFVLLNTSCLNPLITYPYKATPEVMTSTVDKTLGKNEGQRSMCLRTPSAAHSPLASAAFKNHGKVNVHLVSLNASAVTIASLSAANIAIETGPLDLVHQHTETKFSLRRATSKRPPQKHRFLCTIPELRNCISLRYNFYGGWRNVKIRSSGECCKFRDCCIFEVNG